MNILEKILKHQFVFQELTKRDFKQKYKRTILGMGWSIMSPLLNLLVMRIVFTQFFGEQLSHYTTYLFAGNLMFNFFRESTTGGMNALVGNAHIFTKVNVPKYIFVLTKNVSSIINFGITLVVFFLFAALDGVTISWKFITLLYPIACMVVYNVGIGLVLSALFIFFRDISYLYDIFTMLLMYMSAIFYTVDAYPPVMQQLFYCNPIYCAITYVRTVVINGAIPSMGLHLLMFAYAFIALLVGALIYKKKNYEFLYYV